MPRSRQPGKGIEPAKKYGIKFFDTKDDKVVKKTVGDLTLGVCETILNADFLINVPLLKGHLPNDFDLLSQEHEGV